MRTQVLGGMAFLVVASLAGVSQGAIIVTPTVLSSQIGAAYSALSFPTSPSSLTNLTTDGPADWAYWNGVSGAANELNGKASTSLIGTPVFANPNRNGGVYNQTGGFVGTHFAFSDGTSPTSATDLTSAGVTASRGGSLTYSNDPGPSFQFSVPVGVANNTLVVWFSGYKNVGNNAYNITVWDGATQIGSAVLANGAPGGDTGTAYVYQFVYGGGTTTSGTVDFKVQMTGGAQDDATLTLNAAALATVPEPATLGLLSILGSVALLGRRRRMA